MNWLSLKMGLERASNSVIVHLCVTVLAALLIQMISRPTIDAFVRSILTRHYGAKKADEAKREQTLINIFRTFAAVVIWVVATIVILSQLSINVAALLTGAGIVGIVVGFGAQNAIKDFLAGIFVIAENQYRVGDIVKLYPVGQELSGMVEDITIRITRLRDLDGNVHIVPNGAAGVVTNMSFKYANVNMDVRVAYDSDVDKVEEVVNKVGLAMAEDENWKASIINPIQFMRVDGFEDFGVRVKLLGKVEPAKQWEVAGEFRRRLKKAFDESGVRIPLPQREVRDLPARRRVAVSED